MDKLPHIKLAEDEIKRVQLIAYARWGVEIDPAVRWDVRGVVAGYARGSTLIRLNPAIARAEGEAFTQTVAHEFAHLVTNVRFPRARPHGAEWASIMLAFGREARRCHNYESAVPTRRKVMRQYHCSCCAAAIMVGPRHHAAIQRGAILRHKVCGGIVKQFADSHLQGRAA